MRKARMLMLLMIGVTWTVCAAHAIPVGVWSTVAVTGDSDLIVVGTFHVSARDAVTLSNSTTAPGADEQRYLANITPTSVLKGTFTGSQIRVNYLVTKQPSSNTNVTDGQHGLFFLKGAGDNFAFTDPTYPFLPANLGVRTDPSLSPVDQVVQVEIDVLTSSKDDPLNKRSAALSLGGVHDTFAAGALKRALSELTSNVKLEAIGVLLGMGDTSQLNVATDALLTPSSDQDEAVRQNLRVGIRDGVTSSQALPDLSRLVQNGDVQTRRAAMEAIRRIHSPKASTLLSSGLRDSDENVRYHAVLGLSEMNGGRTMHPNASEFHKHESQYTDYWLAHTGQSKP